MRLLLDTHALVWWIRADPQLSPTARAAILDESNEVLVSIAVAWEMAIKVGSRGWPEAQALLDQFEQAVAAEGFRHLAISVQHVRAAGLKSSPHRDPFDRLLAAQAAIEGGTLVTADTRIAMLGAPVLW